MKVNSLVLGGTKKFNSLVPGGTKGSVLNSWGRSVVIAVLLGIWGWGLNLTSAFAAELCVNPGGTGGCYALPSQAVAAAVDGDTILIHAGTYMESATINVIQGLKIIGNNPVNTKVKNAVLENVFTFSNSTSAEIANLTITGGGSGIELQGTGQVVIHHNRIENNGYHGVATNSGTSLIAFKVPDRGSVNPTPLGGRDEMLSLMPCRITSTAVIRYGIANIIWCG